VTEQRQRKPIRQNLLDIAKANPTWNLVQILEKQREKYPRYTETAARQALRREGMPRSKPRLRNGRQFIDR